MKYVDKPPVGSFVDRKEMEPGLESVDVVMATLDSENFLEKSLYSTYREIPVRKLYVCDGGSQDSTIEILEKFPRVEVFVKPEIRTTGKVLEFLISKISTEWFVLLDSDIELSSGWFDTMRKTENLDVIESGFRISAYHLYREDKLKLEDDARASDMCHFIRTKAVKNYHCDDDFMWRYTDYFFRQVIEKSGYKYGKMNDISHVHHETERVPYQSDKEKNFKKTVWTEPKVIITDKKKEIRYNIKHAKAVIKYLDPDDPVIKKTKWFDGVIRVLDRNWVSENGPKWLERYDHGSSKIFSLKKFIYKNFIESRGKAKS